MTSKKIKNPFSMRSLLILMVASVFLISCNKNGYTVNGSVKGVANGKKITLEKEQESIGIMIPINTTKVKDGKFTFNGKVTEPGMYNISIEGEKGRSYIVLEHGDINIEIHKDSIYMNKISGTYNNDQLTEFSAGDVKIQKKLADFQRDNQKVMMDAKQAHDTAVINKLMSQFMAIRGSVMVDSDKYRESYVSSHPKSLISLLLVQNMFNNPTADFHKLQGYFDKLDPDLKNSTVGKKVAKKLSEIKTATTGKPAPAFTAPDVNGKPVSLNTSLGKVTIVDFWASWCPSCRQESPNVVALYNEYHAKGLNIIGVSLDEKADAWKGAIAKDQLTWTQVSNLKKWDDPIAKDYGVEAIPATFILDQSGMIVAKDLQGDKLKDRIAQMLK